MPGCARVSSARTKLLAPRGQHHRPCGQHRPRRRQESLAHLVAVRLLDTTGCRRRLARGLGGELLARGLTAGRLAGGPGSGQRNSTTSTHCFVRAILRCVRDWTRRQQGLGGGATRCQHRTSTTTMSHRLARHPQGLGACPRGCWRAQERCQSRSPEGPERLLSLPASSHGRCRARAAAADRDRASGRSRQGAQTVAEAVRTLLRDDAESTGPSPISGGGSRTPPDYCALR